MRSEPPVVIWVPGDGPASRTTAESLAATVSDEIEVVTAATRSGSSSLASVAAATGRSDIVVVFPGVRLFDGWLPRLIEAARCDTTIATASAMLSEGPWGPRALADDEIEAAARSVIEQSVRLRPRLTAPQAGCVLVRRRALDVAKTAADPPAASPAACLAAFGERCSVMGLGHVLADDVLASGGAAPLRPAEQREMEARWPHRSAARELQSDPETPVRRALLAASRGLCKLSVTLDGRALGPERTGIQVHTLELIAALGRTELVVLRVVVAHDLNEEARRTLDEIEDLTLLRYEEAAHEAPPPTDIVHRPSQVFTADDLNLIAPLGRRLVLTHHDLIAYRIPTYHDTPEHWLRYRRTTRNALSAADRVVFLTEHALADALADDLVDPANSSLVPNGTDHHAVVPASSARRPPRLALADEPFLLCLGAHLRHKNHAFAVELLAALREDHGWAGCLVFAGPSGAPGSAALEQDEQLQVPIRHLGPVQEDEKSWLLANAAAVLYPTLYEGFGLIPFEAGSAGTPCFFGPQSSLTEILPAQAATLIPWDAHSSAAAIAPLLRSGKARDAHVELLRDAASRYRWDDTARALIEIYDEVLMAPAHEARRGPRERLQLEAQLLQIEKRRLQEWQRFRRFQEEIGSDGLGLVGPGGILAADDQRALLALMSQRALRHPVLTATRAAYAIGRRLRRPSSDSQA